MSNYIPLFYMDAESASLHVNICKESYPNLKYSNELVVCLRKGLKNRAVMFKIDITLFDINRFLNLNPIFPQPSSRSDGSLWWHLKTGARKFEETVLLVICRLRIVYRIEEYITMPHEVCSVSNHWHIFYFFNSLLRLKSKKISKLSHMWEGNPPLPGGSPHKGPFMRKLSLCHDVTWWRHQMQTFSA